MNIKEFLELSAGKWFVQRTVYYLDAREAENSKSEIAIDILPKEHSEISDICQEYGIDPNLALLAQKISWDNSVDWGKTKQKDSAVIVFVPDDRELRTGKLLRKTSERSKDLAVGRYVMGDDEALTLIVEDGDIRSEERLWFASPNLRLRTNLSKHSDNFKTTSFYSEIRRITV